MTNRLVLENLKHRPIRTLLSAVAIGVQVTMVLTLVGLSRGTLQEMANRSRGVGADIVVRPPGSVAISFSGNMSAGILKLVREQIPHIGLATGTLVEPTSAFDSVTGIHLDEFSQLSGGFKYLAGGPFAGPDDMLVDSVYARSHKTKIGDKIDLKGREWRVSGIVESGKLARMFVPIETLQDISANTNKITAVYVKLDNPANEAETMRILREKLSNYQIYSMEQMASLFSADNGPLLAQFIRVVEGLGVFIGFLVVFLSMYTAVLERTREIGVLKALGASPGYILNILLRETAVLSLVGSVLGIIFTYGSQWLINTFVSSMTQVIVPDWWPIAAAISLIGSLVGALYPGLKAAQQDAIEALAYD
ncbi:MAG: FtsX-like permease family protein [Bryobacteraceae bacterium]